MALTRKMLKAMGIEEEKIDQIIEAHTETTDALKVERDTFKEKAGQYDDVKKELDGLKANPTDDWKEKHDKVKKEFDDYRDGITAEKTLASKRTAYKKLIEETGIKGDKLINLILNSVDFSKVELEGEAIKESEKLTETIKTEYAEYIGVKGVEGAKVENPPAKTGEKMTREEIYKKDDKGRYVLSTAERQKALANNPDAMKGR